MHIFSEARRLLAECKTAGLEPALWVTGRGFWDEIEKEALPVVSIVKPEKSVPDLEYTLGGIAVQMSEYIKTKSAVLLDAKSQIVGVLNA